MSAHEFELGHAIQAYLNEVGIRNRMKIEAAIADWGRIMGLAIAAKTGKIWHKDGVLYVQMTDPAWRSELTFAKTKIKDVMNAEMGEELIQEVKVM